MDKKLTILVDADDVMWDLIPAWVNFLNSLYGTDVKPSEIKKWEISDYFQSLTQQQVFSVLEMRGFWKTVKPKPSAVQSLKRLIKEGHEVYVCTSTHYMTSTCKFDEMLGKYFPFITNKHLIITSNKQMIKADVLIDDNPNNLKGGDYKGFLMTINHNKSFDEKSIGAIRVSSWKEIMSEIKKLQIYG